MTHTYCTYFDHNYLPRALAMLRSLRAFDSESVVHVLALSSLCELALERLSLPNVNVIPLPDLERAHTELEGPKLTRKTSEYYFTLSPFLPLHVLETTDVNRVTYIDADVHFYASPLPVLDAIGDASIAITPHRFSPDFLPRQIYGHFNVGWITYRRCAEALECLTEYKANCLAWCFDRVENGLFADQAYLNAWPQKYPTLAVIEHKGMNVGVWNADNYEIQERDGGLWVDDEPLVFYHFAGFRLEAGGRIETPVPRRHGSVEGVLTRRIYRPYVARVLRQRLELFEQFPALAAAESDLRHDIKATTSATAPTRRLIGDAWPWTQADPQRDDMFARSEIRSWLEAQIGPTPTREAVLGRCISACGGERSELSVLDWRGGLGMNYHLARRIAPGFRFDWHIVETRSFCDHGQALEEEVRFHDIGGFLPSQRRFDIVSAAGTLGLETDWRTTLRELCRAANTLLVLHPVTTVRSGGSMVVEHFDPRWREGIGLTAWSVSEEDLGAVVNEAGFQLIAEFPGGNLPQLQGTNRRERVLSMLFKRCAS